MFVIKWINRYSGESGYVCKIERKAGHFVNTFDIGKAKAFKSEKQGFNAIKTLCDIGEGQNNEFVLAEK